MDGNPGAGVAGAICRWFDGTGVYRTVESDGIGRVSLADCSWPVIGVARAPGHAATLFWVESPPPDEGFVPQILEPTGSLRIAHSTSTLLNLDELDPRCDPVWHEEHDRSALTRRELQLLTWAALREGLSSALDNGNPADPIALLALHTQARALVPEMESEAPRSALWALPMQLSPERTAGGLVWRQLPARLAWVWSVSKPLGTPLPPARHETGLEIASRLVLPPRLAGRTHSHTFLVPPGSERVLHLDGAGVSTIWLTVPPPVGGDGRAIGPARGLVVHSLVEARSNGRVRSLRGLDRKAPDAMGIVQLDNVPTGEHMLLARWQSAPGEFSLARCLVTLTAGEARDLGLLAPGWQTSVDVVLALVDTQGAELAAEQVFVDPSAARYWLRVPVHSGLDPRDFSSMQVPIALGERLRIVGIAPLEVSLSLDEGAQSYELDPVPFDRAALLPQWRLPSLLIGNRGTRTLAPAGQLERFEIPVERVGRLEVELDPSALGPPEPWPFDELYFAAQADLLPDAGGAGERGRVQWNAVGSLAQFQAPPGAYTLVVRLEPKPGARQPGGALGPARHQGGLVYVGPVDVVHDSARQRVLLEPGSSIAGEIVVQGEPRLTSLHVRAELHLPSGAVARVSLQPSDAQLAAGMPASQSAPFELSGLPPGARVVLSRGHSLPTPLVVPAAGGRLDGVRITVPPR
ncbi:MAG: hypothetical protein GC161_10450 [Planctomycetaceae bacterium]|nr:hypothetical protein [Planctomycetaceae bacterium]